MSLNNTVLPVGTLVVAKVMVTGLAWVAGSTTSALPVGLAGTATPATVSMRSEGRLARKMGPGTSAM